MIKLIDLINKYTPISELSADTISAVNEIDKEYVLLPVGQFEKLEQHRKRLSAGGKSSWAKLSPEKRTRIARERGRAGAAKRWKNKSK